HLVGKDNVALNREPGDVEVQIAVVIVIDEGGGDAFLRRLNAHGLRDVGKFAAAVVVEKMDAIVHAHGEIGFAVVVVVAGSAAPSAAAQFDPGGVGEVGKLAVTGVVQQPHRAVLRRADQQQIGPAIVVVVKKARAGTCTGTQRLRREFHRNGGGGFG